jgi:trigger factor
VERGRVQARLDELIEGYPDPDQARRAYLQNQDAMRQIESGALEEQVVDWILARAKVTERPTTFKELTGFGEAGGEHEHHGHEHEHEHHASPEAGQEHVQVGGT